MCCVDVCVVYYFVLLINGWDDVMCVIVDDDVWMCVW